MKVRLGDVCKIQSGGTPSRSEPTYWNHGIIPWVKISDIKGKYLNTTEEYITEAGLENSTAKIFLSGTILYTIFATLGETCILNIDAATNQAIVGIHVESNLVFNDYLYYYLVSQKDTISKMGRGVAQNNINMKILREFEVPLPPLDEQRRIAAVLDNVSDLIAKRRAQLDKLDELVKARFVEMFGNPVSNTSGWNQAKLGKVTSKIGSGATPRGGKENYHSEGVSLIRSMNIHDGLFLYKDLAHITDEQARQLDNVAVEDKDVFINITGASVARSCIVPHEVLPARVNQHVAIIRCIRSQLNPIFASNMFINDEFKKQLLEIGESGGATRQAITKQQLHDLNIILPPLELQNKFATSVNEINQSKLTIQQSLDKLEILKKALMQEYFG